MQTAVSDDPATSSADGLSMDERRARFLRKLVVLIAGGMFIDGFILGGVGIVMPAVTRDLQLSLAWQGLVGASALIGIFIGGPLGGYLADRFGRKPMFTIDLAIFLVGSVAQFFVVEAWQLFAVRVLMGMAIGADYAIGWPMLAEFSPARMRGKLLSIQEVGWFVGFLIAYALGWALTVYDLAGWNVILGLSTVPTLIVFLLRLGTPESPRWLMSRGRTEEAMQIAADHMEEDEIRDLTTASTGESGGFRTLFSRRYVKATIFVSVFWVCNVTPYFALGTFAPEVLQHLGFQDGLTGGLLLNAIALLGTVVTAFLVERIGRRLLGIPPFYISAVAFVILGLFPAAPSAVLIGCILVFSFVNAISSTLTGVYPSEVFPTSVRGTGVGFAAAVSRVGSAAGTFLLPVSIERLGLPGTMLVAAGICLFGGVVSYILAPETCGKKLSETCGPDPDQP